jgi:uncharacterized protein (DUF1501 family)
MTKISRRKFLVGCSSAIAAMAGSRLTQLAFAEPNAASTSNADVVVVVFLRGAWDALNVFPVLGGADRGYYESQRPDLRVNLTGTNRALTLSNNSQFGMHAAMGPLKDLYEAGSMAVVLACGLNHSTRSHFDAMQFIETGTGGQVGVNQGWLARHLVTSPNAPNGIAIPALSATYSPVASLLGYDGTVTMSEPSGLEFNGHWKYQDHQRTVLRDLYDGEAWAFQAGTRTLNTLNAIPTGDYVPSGGAQYPDHSFGTNLKAIAQIIKADLGLQVATVDFGGWDTHEGQGAGSGSGWNYFYNQLDALSRGLKAFYTDLSGCGGADYVGRTTVIVMSEFGRRLRQNDSGGTDHGHGSAMLLMGGGVKGKQFYGSWPGLAPNQLFDGADLQITTDYRHVLSEVLVKRTGQPQSNLGTIFPGFNNYSPLNLVNAKFSNPLPPAGPYSLYLPMVQRTTSNNCP